MFCRPRLEEGTTLRLGPIKWRRRRHYVLRIEALLVQQQRIVLRNLDPPRLLSIPLLPYAVCRQLQIRPKACYVAEAILRLPRLSANSTISTTHFMSRRMLLTGSICPCVQLASHRLCDIHLEHLTNNLSASSISSQDPLTLPLSSFRCMLSIASRASEFWENVTKPKPLCPVLSPTRIELLVSI